MNVPHPIAADPVASVLTKYREKGLFSHATALIGRLDSPAADREAHAGGPERIYDLSSLTKALVTTPLVFANLSELELTVDHTLQGWAQAAGAEISWLPPLMREFSIASLLRHRSGLPAWRNFWVEPQPQDALTRLSDGLARVAQEMESGQRPAAYCYSDLGFIILGQMVTESAKAATGARGGLSELFYSFCDAKLGFDARAAQLVFGPDLRARMNVVPTGSCAIRGRSLQGEVHDENAWALGGLCGHSGLFGSAEAIGSYLRKTVASSAARHVLDANKRAIVPTRGPADADDLLGWRQGSLASSRGFCAGKTMGHLGFTGTAFWVNSKIDVFTVLLSNRVISGRTNALTLPFRQEAFAALNAMATWTE